MGTIGQTAIDPTGIQSGIIGGRQVGPYRVRKPQRDGLRYVFRLNNWIAAENIFDFYLPAVLVYASIESIQFSPLWVDGSR
jgi:hypothetical protein